MKKRVGRMRSFFGMLLDEANSESRIPVDVYAPMFLCDAICFLIVIFGYSSFGVFFLLTYLKYYVINTITKSIINYYIFLVKKKRGLMLKSF